MADDGTVTKAVILARGLGTRMRQQESGLSLTAQQATAADQGMKGMIPIGRPFLDYVMSALADAGYRDVCIVVGPEHDAIRAHYARLELRRIRLHFAVQAEPRGTADAVLAAETFADSDPFLVINADNYYPVAALAALRTHDAPALAGFDRDALVAGGIAADRIAKFALLDIDEEGILRRIVEKPDEQTQSRLNDSVVSMNCWLLTPAIFEACRRVGPSARGELELPQAVQWLIDERGARFSVIPVREPVLDLSSRADIPVVAAKLDGVTVQL